MTNQPQAHVVRMFGHCKFNPEGIEKEQYIGRVKSVIDNGSAYVISSISPLKGFLCVTDAQEVIGKVEESELTPDQQKEYHSRNEHYEAPNVYDNDPSKLDPEMTVDQKCVQAARNAMAALFPEEKVVSFERQPSYDFNLKNRLDFLDFHLDRALENKELDDKKKKDLRKLKSKYEDAFKKMRFKEYYIVLVGLEMESGTLFWQAAVDKNFEEVSIMRNIRERTDFRYSLGPEFCDMDELSNIFLKRCWNL